MESTPPAAPKRIPPNKRYPRGFRFHLPPIDDNTAATGTGKEEKYNTKNPNSLRISIIVLHNFYIVIYIVFYIVKKMLKNN